MEAKKTPRADMQNRRALFLEIGLVIALGLVVGAFWWGQSEKNVQVMTDTVAAAEEEVIVNTEQPEQQQTVKPQPVQAISDFIDVVRNETKIETDYSFSDFNEDVVVEVPTVVEEVVEEVPTFNPDEQPVPYGGDINAFRSWLMTKALQYPRIAIENNITGTVTIKFVVERDGSLSGFETIASPDKVLTDEAVRALKTSPKWKPGKQRNRPVRVFYVLPVVFKLDQQ